MNHKPLPTQQRLHELFYCVNGKLIRKTKPRSGPGRRGDVVGTRTHRGYLEASVDGKSYRVNRLVWKWFYGADPACEVDHHDWNVSNNNIFNLYDLSGRDNKRHRKTLVERGGPSYGADYIRSRREATGFFDPEVREQRNRLRRQKYQENKEQRRQDRRDYYKRTGR